MEKHQIRNHGNFQKYLEANMLNQVHNVIVI